MKKISFEKEMVKLKLEKVYKQMNLKTAEDVNREYYIDRNRLNIYGYYKNNEEKHVVFFIDYERGILTEIGNFDSEDEAFENLYKFISKKMENEESKNQINKNEAN